MGKEKIAYVSGAILFLLIVSFFIYSQIDAQDDQTISQADLVDMLMQIMGLQDLIPEDITFKTGVLTSRGISPLDGWSPGKTLTKGEAAVVIVKLLECLNVFIPVGAGEEYYVQALVDLGIMKPGGVELTLPRSELIEALNKVAEVPGAGTQAYQEPVTPTT